MVRNKQKFFPKDMEGGVVSIKMSQSWTSKNQTTLRTNAVIISEIILLTRKFLLANIRTHREGLRESSAFEDLGNIKVGSRYPTGPGFIPSRKEPI